MIVYSSLWNAANLPEISWYIIAYYLDFIQLWYILLTFGLVSFEMVQNFDISDLAMAKVEKVNITYA